MTIGFSTTFALESKKAKKSDYGIPDKPDKPVVMTSQSDITCVELALSYIGKCAKQCLANIYLLIFMNVMNETFFPTFCYLPLNSSLLLPYLMAFTAFTGVK